MAAPHWLSRAASALSLSPPGPSNAVPGPTEASASLPPVQGKTLELFTLSLDDGKTIYLPGQRVEGTLSLSFSTPTPVKLLRVRITGLIGTQMTKNDVSLSNHLSSLILFKDLANLGGTGTPEAPLVDFPAGESVHPFSFRLPASALPASFEGAYGKVRYEVIAILMAPGMTKKTVSIPLTVPSTVSDQTHPDVLREPIGQSLSLDTFSPWGWRTGHVDIQARLPKTGFNSGNFTNLCRLEMPNSHLSVIEEIAPLTLDLTNHSQHAVKITEICIKQKVTYKMLHEIRGPRSERIHRLTYTEAFPKTLRKMTRYIQIPIPSVALLSPFIDTPLISVSHILQVKIQAGTRRTKVSLPITICGFPWHALDLDGRQSLEALPLYEPLESEPPQQLSSAIVTTTDETLDAEEDQVLAVGPEDDGPDERTTDLTETLVEATSDPTMESTIEGRDIVQVATVSSTTTAVTSPTTTRPGSVHSSSGSVKEV